MGVTKTYPLRIAAEAAQVPDKTARRWQDNHVITLRGNDATTSGSGNHCGWSRNRILQAAITQALVEKNVSPSASAKAALEFTDKGNACRTAGQLFERGKTALIFGPDGPAVRNLDYSASIFDLPNDAAVVFVIVNRIVEQVDSVLNNSPSH